MVIQKCYECEKFFNENQKWYKCNDVNKNVSMKTKNATNEIAQMKFNRIQFIYYILI